MRRLGTVVMSAVLAMTTALPMVAQRDRNDHRDGRYNDGLRQGTTGGTAGITTSTTGGGITAEGTRAASTAMASTAMASTAMPGIATTRSTGGRMAGLGRVRAR